MKKSFAFIFAGILALSLAGCQKEVNIETDIEGPTHSVVFTADKIIDTKTAINTEDNSSVSYKWIEGDIDRMRITESYEYVENEETKTSTKVGTITSMNITNDGQKATFNVTFEGNAPDAEVTYVASYAGAFSGSGNPLIPAAQSPLPSTFDPAADVLVSDPIVKNARDTENDEFIFNMTRKVSVNKMTLKGLEEGEVISTVTFSSDKNHSAYYTLSTGNYSVNGKVLTLSYTTNNVVPANGEFPVYFTTAPVNDAAFSVRVVTDKNVYEKTSDKTISFACGQVRRFGVTLGGHSTPISTAVDYTLVEGAGQIADGAEYLIVSTKSGSAGLCAAGSFNNSNYYNATDVSATNKVISIDAQPVNVFTLEAGATPGQYFIKDSDDKYLYWNSGNTVNRGTDKSDTYLWTVAFSDGVLYITNVSTTDRKLKYNASSPRFACYTSAQTNISLYVNESTLVVLSSPEISFSPASVNVSWDDKENFVKPTLTNPHSVTVTYTSSDEDVATVDENTGDITFVGNGTTTITASSAKTAEYKAGYAQYTLTVSGKPVAKGEGAENPYSVTEAIEAIDGGSTDAERYVVGIISEIVTEYNSQYKNITFNISSDGLTSSDQFQAYRAAATSASEYQLGDAVIMMGTLKKYGSTYEFEAGCTKAAQLHMPEITPSSSFKESKSVTITAADGAVIYYTIDGSAPTTSSNVYSTDLNITETTTVKAIAVSGKLTTAAAEETFTKNNSSEVTFTIGTDITDIASLNAGVTKNGITLSATTTAWHSPLRFYSGDKITISGATITKVTFNYSRNGDTGKIKQNNSSLTADGAQAEYWTGSLSSVTFENKGTAQARISSVVVEYN
ncbi:MAG: chitobiase/beta-hexosaminidase C-terminal domain-containing protein [Prevotella sp.]|nr:chitobiase/beta-hexosaminidase C-terminal domain-containing protein [Prevotella sp.]